MTGEGDMRHIGKYPSISTFYVYLSKTVESVGTIEINLRNWSNLWVTSSPQLKNLQKPLSTDGC